MQRIIWRYKLSEQTINTPKTAAVEELQVFELELKEQTIPKPVIQLIDRTIPYPILFVCSYEEREAYGIGIKSAGERRYFFTDWNAEPVFDFSGITLERIYENLIKVFLIPTKTTSGGLEAAVATDRQIKALEREIQSLKKKIRNERQFKYQAALNLLLQQKQSALHALIARAD